MRTILALLLTTVALTAADEPLRIRLAALAVVQGGDQRVTCSVERNPKNRTLTVGIENERSSDVDLVANPWVTHELWVRKVSCDAGDAFCVVKDNDGRTSRRVRAFSVMGCPDRSSGFPEN